jgi:hypothetical protein
MDPLALTVYKSPFPKCRLGKDYDGGYIIVDIPGKTYDILLAGGIYDDISFEEDFLMKYKESICLAFDGTINNLPNQNDRITFIKKNIGSETTETITSLHEYITSDKSIFVKMDIEGGEIPWIHSLREDQLDIFEQIIMEFHYPFTDKEIDIFDKMNKNHYLVHFHGNNCCGTRDHHGLRIPNIFECTYLHKKYFTCKPELNTDTIPSELDMPNLEENSEITINYPPFVN